MSTFYEIEPFDTLFFRGAIPMEAGQYNADSMFPPPVSVIKGALWTAFCQKNCQNNYSEKLMDGKFPFDITAVLIGKGDCVYAPAPATWYYDSDKKVKKGKEFKGKELCIAEIKDDFDAFSAQSSAFDDKIIFATPKIDAKPLTNYWVSLDFLSNPKKTFGDVDILTPDDIYSRESRTGNGLSPEKVAKDGNLYTAVHLRFLPDISILVAIEGDIDFGNGKIMLGGEQRIASYRKYTKKIKLPEIKDVFFSLIPVEATEDNLNKLIASGKLFITAGWDLSVGFHKSSKTWIPAGAVFQKNN